MKDNMKLGFILALFAAAACASLAVVYAITGPAIAVQSEKALQESLKDIYPEAASFEDITASVKSSVEGVSLEQAFLVKSSLAPLGVAVKAKGSSYGGAARLLVGVSLTRSIAGVRVLELNDTPGLGANAKSATYYVNKADKVTFPGQYTGKYLTDAFEVKKDVAAITAATITSKALTVIVKAAADSAAAWLETSALAATGSESPAPAEPAAGTDATGGK
jgi:electron transport complex protein RnfG